MKALAVSGLILWAIAVWCYYKCAKTDDFGTAAAAVICGVSGGLCVFIAVMWWLLS